MVFLLSNIKFCFDPPALFFLITIVLVCLPSVIFSYGYLKGHFSSRRIFLGNLLTGGFILSMMAVVSSANLIFFLFAWELMSLLSYFLVIFEHEHIQSIKAGIIYLVMTHIGTAFILGAFFLLYRHAGSFDLAVIRNTAGFMPLKIKNIIFILLLAGFGTKAGIVPLHIWLPYAHPQAPSHISSIMSGVMIKTAIYGLLRFTVNILGGGDSWWGWVILLLAALSCLVGVIYALMEHDLKKLLAYHSVENIGIILLGVGGGMLFLHAGFTGIACVAFAAGLYHLVNHAVFKGLLFLCAGSVYSACGIRDMEKLGGLVKRMPLTAVCFLIGAMAISALPPLNGFVSEWLIFQGLFGGALSVGGIGKFFLGLIIASLALTSGLAAACFVKAFGITFLAMPRTPKAKEAKEVSLSMKLAMVFLSIVTVLLGLGAGFIWKFLTGIAWHLMGVTVGIAKSASLSSMTTISFIDTRVFLNTPLLAAAVFLTALIILLCVSLYAGKPRVVRALTWDCGYYNLSARTEYTATAFSKPFRIAFNFFLLPYRKTEKIRDSFYHVKQFTYETSTTPVFKRFLYLPLLRSIFKAAQGMKIIQMGSIHWYIGYIFMTLLVLIILAAHIKI